MIVPPQEELADHIKRNTVRSPKELAKMVLIRILTNTFTLVVLVGSGTVIYYVADYSLEAVRMTICVSQYMLLSLPPSPPQLTSSSLSPEGLVLPIVITFFNSALPFMFSFLASFERFKTRGGEIKMTLAR